MTRFVTLGHIRAEMLLADIDQERARSLEPHRRCEAAIEAAIALLDRLDAPGEDIEDGGDWEPWLASPEGQDCQLC